MTDINIEEIEACYPEQGAYSCECGWTKVSAQWIYDFAINVLATVDKMRAEPVAWREVSCSDDGTCCYTYNEMGIGEPLFAAPTYKENEDE